MTTTPARPAKAAPFRGKEPGTTPDGLTLGAYAAAKQLPEELLRELGLRDSDWYGTPALAVPYLDQDGHEIAVRFRLSLNGGADRFRWPRGTDAKGLVYGLDGWKQAAVAGRALLVEGESDRQTAARHAVPAFGIPGANMYDDDRSGPCLEGVGTLYALQEPGLAGERFTGSLCGSRHADRIRVFTLGEHKDVSGLHLAVGGDHEAFMAVLEEALAQAVPLAAENAEALAPGAPIRPLAELLEAVEEHLRRYVVLTEAQYVAVALWVAHAHALEAASTTPYLHVTSAEAESGKSRLLEALEQLVPRPIYAASMTPAVLYRAVQKLTPTLLVDEADNLLRDKEAKSELLGLLNAGYRRGALAYRIGGGNRDELHSFETFCAKAIAGLDDLVATLASRCLRIEMQRRKADEHVEDYFRDEAEAEARPIRLDLAAWAEREVEALRWARPARLGVRDRLEEGCRLMLAIAEAAGERWATRAREALRELAGASTGGALSERTQLLTDIRAVYEAAGDPAELTTAELLEGLLGIEEQPWRGWWGVERDGEVQASKGAAQKLAAHLRPFGISSRDVGSKEARRKGYRRADLEAAWERYLLPPPAPPGSKPRTPRTHSRQAKNEASEPAHHGAGCAATGAAETGMAAGGARGARGQPREGSAEGESGTPELWADADEDRPW